MRRMGIEALYQRPRTSSRHREHPVFPYLLRGLTIDRANLVWAMDTTYIPMRCGFVYLTVVLDWVSRRVMAWRLSISLAAVPRSRRWKKRLHVTACRRCIPGRLCPV
jgi:putative transposase